MNYIRKGTSPVLEFLIEGDYTQEDLILTLRYNGESHDLTPTVTYDGTNTIVQSVFEDTGDLKEGEAVEAQINWGDDATNIEYYMILPNIYEPTTPELA